jgi:hypothetical protein
VSSVSGVVVRFTVGSFGIPAMLGIAVLLAPGRFGDAQGRTLLTTLSSALRAF